MTASLETYVQYGKSRVTRAANHVMAVAQVAKPIRILIRSGLHVGTDAIMERDEFVLGPGLDDDIMLLDQSIAGSELRFHVEQSLLGPMLSLETQRSDVMINDRPVANGQRSDLERLPCRMVVGEVMFDCVAQDFSESVVAPKQDRYLLPVVVSVAVAAALILFFETGETAVQPRVDAQIAAAPETSPTTLANVRTRIVDAGLGDQLTVNQNPDGVISVVGRLQSSAMPIWHKLHQEIEVLGGPTVLISQVTELPTLNNIPPIGAVRLGQNPHITLRDGRTIAIGDMLLDGWIVAEINLDGFGLSRAGEHIVITYQ